MGAEVLQIIIQVLLGLLGAICGFLLKRFSDRLTVLEHEVDKCLTEEQTRLLLNDKLEPLKERMEMIEFKIDKLIDLYLKDNR